MLHQIECEIILLYPIMIASAGSLYWLVKNADKLQRNYMLSV
jgi:hypothetical protein